MPRQRKPSSPYELIVYLVAILWGVEIVNLMVGHRLCRFGILPRTLHGLTGIPLSPFLHAGVAHLLLNTGPMLVLGGLVLMWGRRGFIRATVVIILVGGLGLWIVGRPSYHVGASALIFGYFGYLLARGIFDRRMSSLLIAVLVVLAYGRLFWGGHACGFLSGVAAAWIGRRKGS